jgi:hypothetical protein
VEDNELLFYYIRLYEKLLKADVVMPELPLESAVLVTALGEPSKRSKLQALIEFAIDDDLFVEVSWYPPISLMRLL